MTAEKTATEKHHSPAGSHTPGRVGKSVLGNVRSGGGLCRVAEVTNWPF